MATLPSSTRIADVFHLIYCIIFILLQFLPSSVSKFLLLHDENANEWASAFGTGLSDFQKSNGQSFDYKAVVYKNDSNWEEVCQQISQGVSVVIDTTQKMGNPETQPEKFFKQRSIPYFRVGMPFDALLKGADGLLQNKNGSNGFLIFQKELDVNRGINIVLGSTLIRYAFLNAITQRELILEKFQYRVPSAVILYGSHEQFTKFIEMNSNVTRNRTEWMFMYDEIQGSTIPKLNLTFPYFRGYFDGDYCCKMRNPPQNSCDPANCKGNPEQLYLAKVAYLLSDTLFTVDKEKKKVFKTSCTSNSEGDKTFVKDIGENLKKKAEGSLLSISTDRPRIHFGGIVKFEDVFNGTLAVGTYKIADGFMQRDNYTFRTRKRYFRIGIVDFKPWTFKDANDNWVGYCIDLAAGIAGKMDFEYDLVSSDSFGKREGVNGRWNGLPGDLVHGKIDIAVAAYIMTSEREEFIDFVSPYYEQSGLIITMKRPVVKNSLFKFMTVLRTEVWLSIAGATIATALMLWFLDKFSPYSAQNNPHKYKAFRKFTLKESFWFALTSFTPQGGGEPPKAFSGRTLVAAYWIFVVLMLATFTANLAAFLTVERMQSPIRNLEHLAAQSSVKYSVVNTSTAMTFFRNMAHAEETLYQMWRNLTLKAPSSAREYIVWEYPIREMYIHIHSVIQKTKPVMTMNEGLEMAMTDDYYAFIHDAAQTRYEVYRNCNMTLIGEPFAEAPYAIAVSQGNPLQDDISMAILQLQTERFFETLSAKYWTSSCPSLGEGESDGISLESLGGVFIATIIGLGIAFISLAIEVFTTARNRRKAKLEVDNMIKPKFIGPMDFYGASKIMGQNPTTQKSDVLRRAQFLPEVMN